MHIANMSKHIFILLGIHYVSGVTYNTCLDALNKGESANKSSDMADVSGKFLFKVYCEFGLSGGYTFISNRMLSKSYINISNIIPNDTISVLFRMMFPNGSQTETLIEQLPENNKMPLGIFFSNHGNYKAPLPCGPFKKNAPGYLYIGFLSMNDMYGHSRGYMANRKSYIAAKNGQVVPPCYFAIYFSPMCLSGINMKNVLKNTTMSGWYDNSKPVGPYQLPIEYFFQSYLVNCRGNSDFVTYNSYSDTELAIGLPFGFSPPKHSTANTEHFTLYRTTEKEVTDELTSEPFSTDVPHPRSTEIIQPHTTECTHPKTTEVTPHQESTVKKPSVLTQPSTRKIVSTKSGQYIQTTMSQYPTGFSPTLIGSTTASECTCVCSNRHKYFYLAGRNLTREEIKRALQSELIKLKTSIEVQKKNTSAYIRSKTCDTSDKRVSSKAIGSLSIVTIVVPLVLFLLNDVVSVCQSVKKRGVIRNE